uniref:Solute carrier family 19 member 3a n=1 Tax=Oncorhynchus kisutch TaxID=8019 RepID=A0A8C7N821_ONCKI
LMFPVWVALPLLTSGGTTTMGTASRECGPHGRGWVGPTVLLCIYGFCSMMRPSEPFLTDYLTGPYKNLTTKQVWTGRGEMRALKRLAVDCKECYSSVAVLFFCVWSAMGNCGYHQITGYVQLLWASKQAQYNFTEYNGGVEAVATLSGAAASIAVGHVSLDWSVWGELVLGVFTAMTAGVLYLMDLTNSIWICYGLFKTIYMELITICTFQIAQGLSRERYALVFGINSFVGMALQSLLTAIVVNTKSLKLTITSQFLVYASYFAAMVVMFLIRGVYTLLQSRLMELIPAEGQSERRTDLPQVSPLA